MVKYNYFYVIFICLLGLTSYAQKVSNITFKQEQSNILVSYDLETKTPCKVNLYVSTNGGETWQGPLKKVIGDVGDKITSGNHNISWNVLEEFDELRGDKIMFQVRASGEYIETVVIGSQEWTKRNLNVSKYRNGDIIPEVKDFKKWLSLTTGAWCYYDNDPINGSIYGKLYNWYAVNDPRGLAPEGYHIPSETEWKDLQAYLNIGYKYDVAGVKLSFEYKPSTQVLNNHMSYDYLDYWKLTDMLNKSGFDGFFGGQRRKYFPQSNGFENKDEIGLFWSISDKINFSLSLKYPSHINDDCFKVEGYSIRCVKD
jgi:uncharacterized protein (TIGR02145 family)